MAALGKMNTCGQDKCKISIIVPVYNIENYIERCVESLLGQTYSSLEVILVNDGSTDKSAGIVNGYENCENVVVINKANGGLSSARNAGLDAATGQYVMFVDGDDYLDRDALEILSRHLDDSTELILFPYYREYGNRSREAVLFHESYAAFDQGGVQKRIFARLVGPDPHGKNASPLTLDRLNTAWGKLYKRELIGDVRFTDTREIGPEDLWFNIQVVGKCGRAKYVSETHYHYEKTNGSSLMHGYSEDLKKKRWHMYGMIHRLLLEERMDSYIPNLYARIVCEQFGILRNIWLSDLGFQRKKEETGKVLGDGRYGRMYERFDISTLKIPWRFFFWICKGGHAYAVSIIFQAAIFAMNALEEVQT